MTESVAYLNTNIEIHMWLKKKINETLQIRAVDQKICMPKH